MMKKAMKSPIRAASKNLLDANAKRTAAKSKPATDNVDRCFAVIAAAFKPKARKCHPNL